MILEVLSEHESDTFPWGKTVVYHHTEWRVLWSNMDEWLTITQRKSATASEVEQLPCNWTVV